MTPTATSSATNSSRRVARRLGGVTRSTDTLCRFGGDEFLYLAEGISGPEEAATIAERFLRSLDEPFSVGGLHLEQRASLGVVAWDSSHAEVSDVLRDADVALYEAKRLGKGRLFVYVPGMHQTVVNRFSIVQELRQAVTQGDLAMHYQPIVRLATNEVVGFEALMRWHHEERGWVPPGVFIPLAEQSNLIVDLGTFALHESIVAASEWRRSKDSLGRAIRLGEPLGASVPRSGTARDGETGVRRPARCRPIVSSSRSPKASLSWRSPTRWR